LSSHNIQRTFFDQTNSFEDDIFVVNQNFLISYFSHLKQNIPQNTIGICGYTAISMLLSYYDTYWNDNFIPEIYESGPSKLNSLLLYSNVENFESPGVENINMPTMEHIISEIYAAGITDPSSIEYKEALDNKIMKAIYYQIDIGTFLGRLFRIAVDNGSIISYYDENHYHTSGHEYIDGIGVNNTIMNSVLYDYINFNPATSGRVDIITSQIHSDTNEEKERIRNEVIDIVKTGRPVIVGGSGFSDLDGDGLYDETIDTDFGHLAVAYYYDENTDTIYGNMGWGGSDTSYVNIEQYLNLKLADYWALNIHSINASRTDNYVFTDLHCYYCPGLNQKYNKILAENFGFPHAYGDGISIVEKSFELPVTNEQISTSRLRCAYIYDETVNISIRRYSPGIGFLELTFDKEVCSLDCLLSWWSDNEVITAYNSIYRIEYLRVDDEYEPVFDLWNDTTLSTDRNAPTNVSVNFPRGVHSIRFYGNASNPVYSQNKGRLAINSLSVYYY